MTIDALNNFCRNSLVGHLDIVFTEYGETYIKARMPVSSHQIQPMGVLHGGASLALAETVGSAGSLLSVDQTKFDVFGLQVTANHVSTISSGEVTAHAELIHKGNTTHVWDVKITGPDGKLVSVARVTNIVVEKKLDR